MSAIIHDDSYFVALCPWTSIDAFPYSACWPIATLSGWFADTPP
jgi:hypothetical protein